MITKFVLIVWVGYGQNQTLSTQSFDTLAECNAVASALQTEMSKSGWYRCVPYTFDGEAE
jgi:hypothetical protein